MAKCACGDAVRCASNCGLIVEEFTFAIMSVHSILKFISSPSLLDHFTIDITEMPGKARYQ
jgi:hypothetical protein